MTRGGGVKKCDVFFFRRTIHSYWNLGDRERVSEEQNNGEEKSIHKRCRNQTAFEATTIAVRYK